MPRYGALIVFEGVNGAGKTTIIDMIAAYYDDVNIPYSKYKFPNRSGPYGDKIDQYLKGTLKIESKYDILDMFARDRKHVCEQIKKDIQDGMIVLCDRYIFSAIAYQVPLYITSTEVIKNYCTVIGYFDKDMPMPDLVFLVRGDFLRERGIVTKEIFHYVNDNQRELYNILHMVTSQYTTTTIELSNRRGKQHSTAADVLSEIHTLLNY